MTERLGYDDLLPECSHDLRVRDAIESGLVDPSLSALSGSTVSLAPYMLPTLDFTRSRPGVLGLLAQRCLPSGITRFPEGVTMSLCVTFKVSSTSRSRSLKQDDLLPARCGVGN